MPKTQAAGKKRSKAAREPKRTDAEVKQILSTRESRLAYIAEGDAKWWADGESPDACPALAGIGWNKMAAALWYWVSITREANGLGVPDQLPAWGALGGKLKHCGATPETVWRWLCDACAQWPKAKAIKPSLKPISPENVLQAWWRDDVADAMRPQGAGGAYSHHHPTVTHPITDPNLAALAAQFEANTNVKIF